MNKLDKFLRKSSNTFLGLLIIGVFTWVLGKLLDELTEEYSISFLTLLKTRIEVPIFLLILSILFVGLLAIIYRNWSISRRKLRVLHATYGANETQVDITSELNKAVIDNKLKIVISNALAGDPLPGVVKVASVHYEYAGKKENKNINEGEVLELP